MTAPAFACGQPRSPRNTLRAFADRVACRACRDARIAEAKARTAGRDAEIRAMVAAGEPLAVIAARFGLSVGRVRGVVHAGLPPRAIAVVRANRLWTRAALATLAGMAGCTPEQLLLDWRLPRELVLARWAVMRRLRERGASLNATAGLLRRDRSSVRHGLACGDELAGRDATFDAMLAAIPPGDVEAPVSARPGRVLRDPAHDEAPPVARAWCAQCERRVNVADTARCASRFCKAPGAAASAVS